MADSAHITNLSRRRALLGVSTGIAAANVLGVAAGVALASTDDAELFACWREYLSLEAEMNEAFDARDSISWNARQAYPPEPECVAKGWVRIVDDDEADDGRGYIAVDTRREVNPRWEESAELMDEAEAWIKECEATQDRLGRPAAEAAYEAAEEKYRAAFDRFLATPADTLAGMAFKTSAMLYFDHEAQYAWKGIVVDRQSLEQDKEILLELRKDLLRFAGLPDDFALEFAEDREQYFAKPDSHEEV